MLLFCLRDASDALLIGLFVLDCLFYSESWGSCFDRLRGGSFLNGPFLCFSGFSYPSSGMSTPDMGLQSPLVTGKRSLPGELGSNSVLGSIPVKRARSSATNLRPRASHSCISPGIIASHPGLWMLDAGFCSKGPFPLLARRLVGFPL